MSLLKGGGRVQKFRGSPGGESPRRTAEGRGVQERGVASGELSSRRTPRRRPGKQHGWAEAGEGSASSRTRTRWRRHCLGLSGPAAGGGVAGGVTRAWPAAGGA